MINGAILIGASEERSGRTFQSVNPSSGEPLDPSFAEADASHVEKAAVLAEAAFPVFSELEPDARAAFLEAVAEDILAIGDPLIERAMAETGLPRARLEGERGRTVGQLRMFAEFVRQGTWVHATIDSALPEREPLPRPDLRRRHVALGPVAAIAGPNLLA